MSDILAINPLIIVSMMQDMSHHHKNCQYSTNMDKSPKMPPRNKATPKHAARSADMNGDNTINSDDGNTVTGDSDAGDKCDGDEPQASPDP